VASAVIAEAEVEAVEVSAEAEVVDVRIVRLAGKPFDRFTDRCVEQLV
jgi:hypothetical protein